MNINQLSYRIYIFLTSWFISANLQRIPFRRLSFRS